MLELVFTHAYIPGWNLLGAPKYYMLVNLFAYVIYILFAD